MAENAPALMAVPAGKSPAGNTGDLEGVMADLPEDHDPENGEHPFWYGMYELYGQQLSRQHGLEPEDLDRAGREEPPIEDSAPAASPTSDADGREEPLAADGSAAGSGAGDPAPAASSPKDAGESILEDLKELVDSPPGSLIVFFFGYWFLRFQLFWQALLGSFLWYLFLWLARQPGPEASATRIPETAAPLRDDSVALTRFCKASPEMKADRVELVFCWCALADLCHFPMDFFWEDGPPCLSWDLASCSESLRTLFLVLYFLLGFAFFGFALFAVYRMMDRRPHAVGLIALAGGLYTVLPLAALLLAYGFGNVPDMWSVADFRDIVAALMNNGVLPPFLFRGVVALLFCLYARDRERGVRSVSERD